MLRSRKAIVLFGKMALICMVRRAFAMLSRTMIILPSLPAPESIILLLVGYKAKCKLDAEHGGRNAVALYFFAHFIKIATE